MKKIYLSCLILFALVAHAFTQCDDCNKLHFKFLSDSITELNDTLNLTLEVWMNPENTDTLNIDTFYCINNSDLEFLFSSIDTGIYSGDTIQYFNIGLLYDTTDLPFYLQEFTIHFNVNNEIKSALVYFYFTPWNTIEVYNMQTLPPDRQWLVETAIDSYQRVYIHPDSLPSEPDTTQLLCYKYIEGLAYVVLVNCDTTTTDSIVDESLMTYNGYDTPDSFWGANIDTILYDGMSEGIWKTFKGRITGTIVYNYDNEGDPQRIDNNIVQIPIAKARVVIYHGIRKINAGFTNDTGYFDIPYEYRLPQTDGNIKVHVEVEFQDKERNKLKVFYNNGLLWDDKVYGFKTGKIVHNVSRGQGQPFELGTMIMGSHRNAHIYHWARRAYDFAKTELDGWDVDFEYLKIRVAKNPKEDVKYGCAFRHYRSIWDGHIVLREISCLEYESTIMHEMGHYVQHIVQNKVWADECNGNHSFRRNNKHPNQTISEGFATAFAAIVDQRYYTDDLEIGHYKYREYHPSTFDSRENINANVHQFTSEALFTYFIVDLWDSDSKITGYGFPLGTFDYPVASDITDNDNDEVSLTFKQICRPFYENNYTSSVCIQDVQHYISELLLYLDPDCELRRNIKKVADINFIPDIWPTINAYDQVNTDLIERSRDILHLNENIGKDKDPEEYVYSYFLDPNDLGSLQNRFNVVLLPTDGTHLSDQLDIFNEGALYINTNRLTAWQNDPNGSAPPLDSWIDVEVCNVTTSIVAGGTFEIGTTDHSSATVTVTGKTEIILGDNTHSDGNLIINDESRLIIDESSTLTIWQNANIELNGENAVLEINGKLNIEDNSEFTFSGTGYVVLNETSKIILGDESKITLDGTGTSDKILEVNGATVKILRVNNSPAQEVILRDGTIEMSDEGEIVIDVPKAQIRNVVINNKDEDSKRIYNGIFIGTRSGDDRISLNNITINNANQGLKIYAQSLKTNVHINSIYLNNCNEPLFTHGGGFNMQNVNINGDNQSTGNKYGNGWIVSSLAWPSTFNGSIINNKYNGITVTGYQSYLTLKRPIINDNEGNGIYFNGSTLNGYCGEIKDNEGNGVVLLNKTLEFSPDYNKYGGYMDLSGNEINTIFINGKLRLNNGHNNLIPYDDYYDIVGSVRLFQDGLPQSASLVASYNQWATNQSPPFDPSDYCLVNPWVVNVVDDDYMTIVDESNFTFNSQSTYCNDAEQGTGTWDPNNDWYKYTWAAFIFPLNYTYPTITTTSFTNEELNDAVEYTMDVMYNDTGSNYVQATNLFFEILNEDYETPDTFTLAMIDFAYEKMMEAVGKGVADSQIVVSAEDPLQEPLHKLNVIQTKFRDNITVTDTPTYQKRYRFAMDRATTYRMAHKRELAKNAADSILQWVHNEDLSELAHFRCINSLEMSLIDGEITIIQFDSLLPIWCPCSYDTNFYNPPGMSGKKVIDREIEKSIKIYPNPATEEAIVELPATPSGNTFIYIYDLNGKIIRKQKVVSEINTVDLSGYEKGIYIIEVKGKRISYKDKLIKE
jgi:hypothetical protein